VRKGFIAAPLLGTILFLTSVIFVVNMNKAESAQVALIANEAYQNRVTSLLELYRSDMGSQFRENLARVIEDFLSSKCWDNLFRVTNKKFVAGAGGGSVPGGSSYLDEKVLRYRACSYVNDVIHDVICSHSGGEVCDEDCLAGGGSKSECCDDTESYGLPKWMRQISETFVFEGIRFESANEKQFEVFLGGEGYGDACRTLVSTSLMDCRAFAEMAEEEGKLQCCTKTDLDRGGYTYQLVVDETGFSSECDEDDVIDCSKGTFYVEINVEEESIYPHLPRTKSSDGKGNEIRTGAISDANFHLPVNYPLYKYYDYAFKVYRELASEVNPAEGKSRLCYEEEGEGLQEEGKADCGSVTGDEGAYSFHSTSEESIINAINDAVQEACTRYSMVRRKESDGDYWGDPQSKNPSGHSGQDLIALELCTESGDCGSTDGGWSDCENEFGAEDLENVLQGTLAREDCGEGNCYAVLQWTGAAKKMRFLDYSASVRTDPAQPNQFCYNLQPHYEPENA
jgi:hypothetical protein